MNNNLRTLIDANWFYPPVISTYFIIIYREREALKNCRCVIKVHYFMCAERGRWCFNDSKRKKLVIVEKEFENHSVKGKKETRVLLLMPNYQSFLLYPPNRKSWLLSRYTTTRAMMRFGGDHYYLGERVMRVNQKGTDLYFNWNVRNLETH